LFLISVTFVLTFQFLLELYEKDADIAHQEFDWKLTDRVNMKMCGVPESSFETWVRTAKPSN
jgi:DNA mismatch repair ATPase MutS